MIYAVDRPGFKRFHCNEITIFRRRLKWQERDLLARMENAFVGEL